MSDIAACRLWAVALLFVLFLPATAFSQVPVAGPAEPVDSDGDVAAPAGSDAPGKGALSAPDTIVTPSKQQVRLNAAGVSAMIDGNFEAAVEKFLASLALGELNVTYLNLGRAYSKLGRCADAKAIFAQVGAAPVVDNPPLADIQSALARYEKDLADACVGTFIPTCEEPGVTLSIDGEGSLPCDGEPLLLLAGKHTLDAVLGERTRHWEFEMRPRSEVQLLLAFDETTVRVVAPSPFSQPKFWAYAAAGTGAVLLATALVVDLAVLGPDIDDYEKAARDGDAATFRVLRDSISSTQNVNLGLTIGGAALVAAGAAISLFYPETEQPQAAFWVDPGGGAGAALGWTF